MRVWRRRERLLLVEVLSLRGRWRLSRAEQPVEQGAFRPNASHRVRHLLAQYLEQAPRQTLWTGSRQH